MHPLTRREFLYAASMQIPGDRPPRDAQVEVLNPLGRVPVSLIIDDSTCLVNLNRFAIPQFRAAWNNTRYEQNWRAMPHEIPDDFVRRFGDWCGENGVKGKYSVVPFPACVGRLDLEVPGWTREEIAASIRLVRDRLTSNWDIHPEMVTHTRIIDLKTGHPVPQTGPSYMENWNWCAGRSVDEIASYMAYGLQILHNIGLPCEGLTTPGGFGHDARPQLAQATLEAVRQVFRAEIPHYFHTTLDQGQESVAPRVEYASGLDSSDPRCVVHVLGCTGDWTGNWDCSTTPEPDRFISADLRSGRLVEIIGRGEPACLLCHWTGIHYNGRELGFQCFQTVVQRLRQRYGNTIRWMKLSEIARYWAAKELTRIERAGNDMLFHAPFACPDFTIHCPGTACSALRQVKDASQLQPGTFVSAGGSITACLSLTRGSFRLTIV
jgi:hypothetical protein